MNLNRIKVVVLIIAFTALSLYANHSLDRTKVEYINFSQITLQNILGFLSNEYKVNFDVYSGYGSTVISVHMQNTNLKTLLDVIALQSGMRYEQRGGVVYFIPQKEHLKQKFIDGDYYTDKVEMKYAAVGDVLNFLNDMMRGQTVVRTSTQNEPYENLYSALPDLKKPEFKKNTESSVEDTVYPRLEINMGAPTSGTAGSSRLPRDILYLVPFYNENTIYFLSTDKKLIQSAKKFAEEVDKPSKQVLIQGEIIEFTLGEGFNSVFDFKFTGNGMEVKEASTIGLGNIKYSFLDAKMLANINIAKSENRATFLSSPVLLTMNRVSARLDLSEEVSVVTGITEGSVVMNDGGQSVVVPPMPKYEKKNIGTQLFITPYINNQNEILLKIDIAIAALSGRTQTITVPMVDGTTKDYKTDSISQYTINTLLTTADRQSIVFGGLIRESTSKDESKVPILGDIPILGIPFRDVSNKSDKKELIVVLTPIIVDLQNPDAVALEDRLRKQVDGSMDRKMEFFKDKEEVKRGGINSIINDFLRNYDEESEYEKNIEQEEVKEKSNNDSKQDVHDQRVKEIMGL